MQVVYSNVYMLDDGTAWKELPPMPKPDSHIEFAWVNVNNSLIIVGGTTDKHPITKKDGIGWESVSVQSGHTGTFLFALFVFYVSCKHNSEKNVKLEETKHACRSIYCFVIVMRLNLNGVWLGDYLSESRPRW